MQHRVMLALVAVVCVATIASADWCSFNPLPVEVPAGKSTTVALDPTELADCDSKQAIITTAPEKGTATTAGSVLVYIAPNYDVDDVMRVTVRCTANISRQCDALIGFIVSSTTAAPTTSPNVMSTTTMSPASTIAPLPTCGGNFPIIMEAAVSTVLRGKFSVPLDGCAISTFTLGDNSAASGRIMINFIGEYLIVASDSEGTQEYTIQVGCSSASICQFSTRVLSYKPISPPSTTAAIESCPAIYYYTTPIGTPLSSSLADMSGQLSCPNGRTFSLVANPAVGSLVFYVNGDFTYDPQSANELYTSFNFQMACGGVISCSGVAHLLVSGTSVGTLPTEATTTATSTPFVSDGRTTCSGTCNSNALKVFPTPGTAPTDTARSDGVPIGTVEVSWGQSSLIIKGSSKIGNLAQQFLTFDPVADLTKLAAAPTSSFNNTALKNQGADGLGVEVWTWTNLSKGEGHVGIRYNSGSSWYQKFGGLHIGCDTYSKGGNTYAPLLTPAAGWSIDINNCDATWTGRLSLAKLTALRTLDDRAVFRFVGNDMDGVVYTETIQPASWLNPQSGIATTVAAHPISVTWRDGIQVVKDATQRTFTLDAEFFQYTDADGDAVFGINLMLFGVTTSGEDRNAPDRHVTGFKWVSQAWDAIPYACPSCGTVQSCAAQDDDGSESTFNGAFKTNGCGNKSFVTLAKGPSTNGSSCPQLAGLEVNRPGFSAPDDCGAYQNITIRGKAPGSRSKASDAGFRLSGTIQLQLFMENGNKPLINVVLSQYVARLSTSSTLAGQLSVCRASTYFPVYDPIGTSLPNSPFTLADKTAGSLCVDEHDAYFGPHSWATFTVASATLTPSGVVVRSITVLGDATWNVPVVLVKNDANGVASTVQPADGYWWKKTHPFLSFRLIDSASLTSGVAASFAFVPGTIGQDGPLTVSIQLQDKATGDFATFTKIIYVDKLLTDSLRYGVATVGEAEDTSDANSGIVMTGLVSFCAIGVVLIGLMVVCGDNNRKLPRWLPRGALRKKHATKPKVIQDPYAAALHV